MRSRSNLSSISPSNSVERVKRERSRTRQSRSRSRSRRRSHKRVKYLIPMLDGPLVPFRVFMENQVQFKYTNQPDNVDREKADKHYREYKQKYEQKQNEIFFHEHRDDAWFIEKYNPYLKARLSKESLEEKQTLRKTFLKQFETGYFDQLNLQVTQQVSVCHQQQLKEIQDDTEENNVVETNEDQGKSHAYQEILIKQSYDITQPPFYGFDANKNTLFIKTVPRDVSRTDLIEIFEKLPGFISLSLSDPFRHQDYQRQQQILYRNNQIFRYGWIQFDSQQATDKAEDLLQTLMIKDFTFSIVKSHSYRKIARVVSKINVKKTVEITEKLIQAYDQTLQATDNPILKADLDLNTKLDLQLLYLRKVHAYCYISGQQYQDERILGNRSGVAILRLKSDEEQELNLHIPNWQTRVFQLAQQKVEELEAAANQVEIPPLEQIKNIYMKKFEANRNFDVWGCLYCNKKFKGASYLMKHIENKHEGEELYQKDMDWAQEQLTLANYCNDKNRITNYPTQSKLANQGFKKMGGRGYPVIQSYRSNDKQFRKYRDLDNPGESTQTNKADKQTVNYNDI